LGWWLAAAAQAVGIHAAEGLRQAISAAIEVIAAASPSSPASTAFWRGLGGQGVRSRPVCSLPPLGGQIEERPGLLLP
jgi:hypothetical protein